MRLLLTFLATWVTMVVTLLPGERQALIPLVLRKRLCELSGKSTICDFNEVPSAPVDDANYSKWSICKFHPELLLCTWDPIKKISIPAVHYQPQTTPAVENSANVDQADFSAIDLSQATAFMESSAGVKEPLKVKESPILRGAKTDNRPFYPRTNGPIGNREKQALPPRYDGKLSVENELDVHYGRKPVASPEVDEFDENILMASDNVFGG